MVTTLRRHLMVVLFVLIALVCAVGVPQAVADEVKPEVKKLNTEGKAEARKQVRNLTKIEDYTKDTGSSASAAG